MSRLGSWLRGSSKSSSTTSLRTSTSEDEEAELKTAMTAAAMIINDDLEGADRELSKGDSSFHMLGRGITSFMRALLGFEADAMKDAADRLYKSECKGYDDQKRIEKDKTRAGLIYPPGAEYILIQAMSMLMAALVGVLNESLTESLKGFYKMRKAYLMLDGLMAAEDDYVRKTAGGSSRVSLQSTQPTVSMPGGFDNTELDSTLPQRPLSSTKSKDDESAEIEVADTTDPILLSETSIYRAGFDRSAEATIFTRPIDQFTHSGVSLNYGLLLLVISLIPPAFKPILGIIGFKGDRERGLTLLWDATQYDNINGAVAGLVLLGVYNGLTGFCDILPDSEKYPDDIMGYPRSRCESLLRSMRARYPESRLWRLEEARMQSSKKELRNAIEILRTNTDSNMKQIRALNMFEKGLNCMYAHEWHECIKSFEACMELNTWSHCLYIYIMAACYVELFRVNKHSNPEKAMEFKTKAATLIRDAPSHSGKKKFMAKQLPFDVYVVRKVQKWEERAKLWQCDIVDAVGVSPIGELTYLWAGHKRMPPAELTMSLARLDWNETTFPEKHKTNLDESGLRALLCASVFKNQKDLAAARAILEMEVLCHDRSMFKGPLNDDWAAPSANYEMAVISWLEKDLPAYSTTTKLQECEEWLGIVSKWEAYTLDARIGLRVTMANETLRRYKEGMQV